MKSVLIAHSNLKVTQTLETALVARSFTVIHISNGAGAIEILDKKSISALMVEKNLPQVSGMDLMAHVKERFPYCRVILISPDSSARDASLAYRAGAFDYLTQPVDTGDLAQILERLCTAEQEEIPGRPADFTGRFSNIIGSSPAIQNVFRLVDKVAATDSTVMIYGESGTGKELIARAIHENSLRCGRPLIPVNCGAIPEELLESELFGHEKGAFTSAIRTRMGRFEMSDGGTIFLDEIADMSPKLQVKILRVLQEHSFERIGGTKTIEVDIRVITATNKELRTAMEEGRFREDLFYRLNVIPITVPPLRNRREDIPDLVTHFLRRFQETRDSDVVSIEADCMENLVNYNWPGNIRELENIIERMVILAEGDILTRDDLPPRINNSMPLARPGIVEITSAGIDFNQVVSDFENQLLISALEKADWVKNRAAQLLRLNRTTLVEKLKKKNIKPPTS